MKPPHWRCRGCGIIIIDCGSAPSSCRFCQSSSGFEYMGYEGDYDLHNETDMYRALHLAEEPNGPIFSNTIKDEDDSIATQNLLNNIDTKRKKNEK